MSGQDLPLHAIRAFDALARHQNFRSAASELGVTSGALSYQIRKLEEHLGVKLCRRLARVAELTKAGQALAPKIRRGFEHLDEGFRKIARNSADDLILIWVTPSLNVGWFLPRIHRFVERPPEVRVRQVDRWDEPEFVEGGFCAELVSVNVPSSLDDPERVVLFPEYMIPVLSPRMCGRAGGKGSDLLQTLPLLQDASEVLFDGLEWSDWFEATESPPPEHAARYQVYGSHAVVVAASNHCGIALARLSIALPALVSGQLVAPFDTVLECGPFNNQFRCPAAFADEGPSRLFFDWLIEESAIYSVQMRNFLSEQGKSVARTSDEGK